MALTKSNDEKIGKWITQKTTKLFLEWDYNGLLDCFHRSYNYAHEKKSYHYPIFKRVKNKLMHVGYAVPK